MNLRNCGSCDSPFYAEHPQARFCPSCAGARRYDAQVRMRMKKRQGVEYLPHCAKCGAETMRGHSYCLACATLRRLDLQAKYARRARARVSEADFQAENQRHR